MVCGQNGFRTQPYSSQDDLLRLDAAVIKIQWSICENRAPNLDEFIFAGYYFAKTSKKTNGSNPTQISSSPIFMYI